MKYVMAPKLKPMPDPFDDVPELALDDPVLEPDTKHNVTPRHVSILGPLPDLDLSTHHDAFWVTLVSMMTGAELRAKVDTDACLAYLNSRLCTAFGKPTLTNEVSLVCDGEHYLRQFYNGFDKSYDGFDIF